MDIIKKWLCAFQRIYVPKKIKRSAFKTGNRFKAIDWQGRRRRVG
jgi:hypothetical protein